MVKYCGGKSCDEMEVLNENYLLESLISEWKEREIVGSYHHVH